MEDTYLTEPTKKHSLYCPTTKLLLSSTSNALMKSLSRKVSMSDKVSIWEQCVNKRREASRNKKQSSDFLGHPGRENGGNFFRYKRFRAVLDKSIGDKYKNEFAALKALSSARKDGTPGDGPPSSSHHTPGNK